MSNFFDGGQVFDSNAVPNPVPADTFDMEIAALLANAKPEPRWDYLDALRSGVDAVLAEVDPSSIAVGDHKLTEYRHLLEREAGLDLTNPLVAHAFGVALVELVVQLHDDAETCEHGEHVMGHVAHAITKLGFLFRAGMKEAAGR